MSLLVVLTVYPSEYVEFQNGLQVLILLYSLTFLFHLMWQWKL